MKEKTSLDPISVVKDKILQSSVDMHITNSLIITCGAQMKTDSFSFQSTNNNCGLRKHLVRRAVSNNILFTQVEDTV